MAAVEELLQLTAAGLGPRLAGHAAATVVAGGKRLRPLLVVICSGDRGSDEDVVAAATAVELLHVATLVHDDVLDDAPLRRGRPTVHALAGRDLAVHTGDALFAAAFTLLVRGGEAGRVRALAAAASALARGELLQRADAWDATVGRDRYELRCELKTARLFEAACALGALCAGEDPEPLRRYAHGIGIAFQMLDDVLDVEGPPERTGKAIGTDLLDGTITLPLLLAREREPALAAIDPRSVADPAAAAELCAAIVATGATATVRELAGAQIAAAKAELASFDEQRRRLLTLVADSVVARYA